MAGIRSDAGSSARLDVVVIGGACTDFTVRADRLPAAGGSAQGDEFLECAGGKGANQAVAAARLGARAALIARVGDDRRGRIVRRCVEQEGVDVSALRGTRALATGATVIQVDASGEHQTMYAPGANSILSPRDVRDSALLARTRVLLFLLEPPMETVLTAARMAREAGAHIVLDPAPAPSIPDELLRLTDILRCNAHEAESMSGVPVRDAESAASAAERLRARGLPAAIIAAGHDGDLLSWEHGVQLFPHHPVRSVDVTGAGDAFSASIAVGLAEGMNLAEAAALGSAAAALTTTRLGAMPALPTRDEVTRMARGRQKRTPNVSG